MAFVSNTTKITEFTRGRLFFEVFETNATDGFPFVGYCDGVRSVSGNRADVAARALEQKHVIGLPEGKLINAADRFTE